MVRTVKSTGQTQQAARAVDRSMSCWRLVGCSIAQTDYSSACSYSIQNDSVAKYVEFLFPIPIGVLQRNLIPTPATV